MNALRAEFAVAALLRRASSQGAYGAVVRRGDAEAGTILVVVRTLDGRSRLYSPIRDMSGERAWLATEPMEEREIDLKVGRRVDTDPDAWVVEIEDRRGRHFLVEPIDGA